MSYTDNIVALATPSGTGAIAVIRVSGPDAITLMDPLFKSIKGKKLANQKSHTIHLGHIVDDGKVLDEVLVSLFKGPHSYTGENVVEISCHGSPYIQQQIIQLILRNGCRSASAGEFTLRAFLNGKMDLSQAEAVADLIASDSEAAHDIAMQQMRGGFSNEIQELRQELLNFASLIELELDFSQEDVEFADRTQFNELLNRISEVLKKLIDSFALGNVIKNGIPVAIVGQPNVGKSTLLNVLLNEERAIVSEIAGTTRDTVEDHISIKGINFRFIDTAGIRETVDVVEKIGIERTFDKIEKARLIIYLFDGMAFDKKELQQIQEKYPNKRLLPICNKTDLLNPEQIEKITSEIPDVLFLSAKLKTGIPELEQKLLSLVDSGALSGDTTIITNSRHYDALLKALEEIQKVKEGLEMELSSDLMAIDIRQALYHLGEITGSVTTDDLLGNIFSNFCIGK
ncbi:MAG: tRNA uridine-5-carboxymethylaminomethyl(34) synthesis GTPase MnmE [Muricauda sp.]|nr:tRNA uridine-5-carboxymethylaminomethyl(34) synthesis GTPase MnmE [Allomuricauda sp.]MBO6533341.1 tRNA uridine-5-carboxymethylaminomethyl(34) synthesis GTPase MnmE [Allomuricauda sp.]MBO6589812.1 tRNA uridine-5-carboxymethylaminomethyl(34) synthesis GTPase MnmE [Allomuricauda sp.]MBO6619255.1 tRNA uridine-5-carboxymethylaminomethyl(34) synthesis GTPase MnmE [Allomuricauda sp.]MBO6645166.1 tRNA uridine-5-carboxymethylaminomethyl(34) synthesis GTPase MnmE [Allomuricauda sp.]MBO6747558.1 tRNA 